MSQQLLLDISSATARSKGQARRRHQPALSEEARKAQRNQARRERARRKTTEISQMLLWVGSGLPYNLTTPANFARPSVQPSPYADQPQCGSPPSTNEEIPPKVPPTVSHSHCPAFTVLPAHASNFNSRALAQSTRYIAAQTKARETKTTVRRDVQQVEDLDGVLAQDGYEYRPNPEGEDIYAARILFGFAKDQHAIFAANDTGIIPVNTSNTIEADGTIEHPQKCPVTNCKYHRMGFLLKKERDEHAIQHFGGAIECGYPDCWYHDMADSEVHFANAEQLRDHVHIWHPDNIYYYECSWCGSRFEKQEYVEHIDDCIIHAVELEALERA